MVGEAVYEAFTGKVDSDYGWSVDARNFLEVALQDATRKSAPPLVEAEVKRLIGGEGFIDTVVDRINRKQLQP